jgi:hypothetical protein
MGARQEDLRAALLAADVIDIGADAVAITEGFARNGLVTADDALSAAEINDDIAIFDALDGAVDDLADAILNSSNWRSRSASRTFCTITCLADWAAIRPKSIGGSGSAIKSPSWASGLRSRASASGICKE